jgi:hypothetical protein
MLIFLRFLCTVSSVSALLFMSDVKSPHAIYSIHAVEDRNPSRTNMERINTVQSPLLSAEYVGSV